MKRFIVYLFLFNVISFAFAQGNISVKIEVNDLKEHNAIADAPVSYTHLVVSIKITGSRL